MTSGVIIVAWNGERYLRECVGSVLDQATPPREIVLIDNASDDDSVKAVQAFETRAAQLGSNLRILCQSKNLGFTLGANAGLRALMSSHANVDYAILLNQDATLERNWCETVGKLLDTDASVGAVGSKIFLPDRLTIQHAGGYLERPRLLGRHFGHHLPDNQDILNTAREVEFVTGAAMALRITTLVQVGLFQEIFSPGYYEDVELCARIHEAGWKVMYCPEAVAVHVESASFQSGVERLSLSHRNRLIYALRWLAEPAFREEFCGAEHLHIRSGLPSDERRALMSAYLRFLLVLPDAIEARVARELVTPALCAELIHVFAELREDLASLDWETGPVN